MSDSELSPVSAKSIRRACLIGLSCALSYGSAVSVVGCSREPVARSPNTQDGAREQVIVERAAAAFARLRSQPRFSPIEFYLERARAVMIFPRLVKASLIFGGEGGNGVLLARASDGSWSDPAFYSLGSPSVGIQIGYQEATVALFIMDQPTLERVLRASLSLGATSGATLGSVGERDDVERKAISKNIYQVAETGGVFAGVSLEGNIIGVRDQHNLAYYGRPVTPREIVIDRTVHRSEADVLREALARRGQPAAAAPPAVSEPMGAPQNSPAASADFHECSVESRQVAACAEIHDPVCGELDTGVRCVRAPCPESRTTRTFDNACKACLDPKTYGYRALPCTGRPR